MIITLQCYTLVGVFICMSTLIDWQVELVLLSMTVPGAEYMYTVNWLITDLGEPRGVPDDSGTGMWWHRRA